MPKRINTTDRVTGQTNEKFHITKEGFLVFDRAIIARSGTQDYFGYEWGMKGEDAQKRFTVYRPEEEVFSKESMESFANTVATNDHPPVFVNPENAKDYQVGYTGDNITREGDLMLAKLIITDAATIKDIQKGKRQISNGYSHALDFTPGIAKDGTPYDAIQSDIVGNHISIVEKARCGPTCNVNDSNPEKVIDMKKVTIDSIDYEVTEQAAQAIAKLQKSVDTAEAKAEAAEDEKEDIKKKSDKEKEEAEDEKEEAVKKATDSLQAKVDQLTQNQMTPESLDAIIVSRTAIINVAAKAIDGFKPEGKDCEAIKREVVLASMQSADSLEGKSQGYIEARYDLIAESTDSTMSSSLKNAFRKNAESTDAIEEDVVAAAQAKQRKRSADAWKEQ